ncbi:MAG: hypothetical protein NUW12_06145 [Firmicutes bacterium]|jgi:hypothetical protein|nr:hypothetical protein [Bacillota bacterium]MDH7495730.1 hypothetical protein [Bacillota bacterium]
MAHKGRSKDGQIPKKRSNNGRIPRKIRWTLEEVREMPTDKILAALHSFGIPISMEALREQVKEFCSAEDLSEHWFDTYSVTATGWDEDFPWFAAWVLWERLDGDTIPYESVTELMAEGLGPASGGFGGRGYDDEDDPLLLIGADDLDEGADDLPVFPDDERSGKITEDEWEDDEASDVFDFPGSPARASVCWMQLRAWDYVKALFSGKATSIEEAMEICSCASSLDEWCVALADNLGFESASSPSLARERLRFAREFCELFPESDEEFIRLMRSAEAEALFALGRIEEGEEVFATLMQQWPDWTWGYVYWGDAYIRAGEGHPERLAKAREVFRAALRLADESDAEIIRDRLEDLGDL